MTNDIKCAILNKSIEHFGYDPEYVLHQCDMQELAEQIAKIDPEFAAMWQGISKN